MSYLNQAVEELTTIRSTIISKQEEVKELERSIQQSKYSEKEVFEKALETFIAELNQEYVDQGLISERQSLVFYESSMAGFYGHEPSICVVGIQQCRVIEFAKDLSYADKLKLLIENEPVVRKVSLEWAERISSRHKSYEKMFSVIHDLFFKQAKQMRLVGEPDKLELTFYPDSYGKSFKDNILLKYKDQRVCNIELPLYYHYSSYDIETNRYLAQLVKSLQDKRFW